MKKRILLVVFLIVILIIAGFSVFEILSRKKPKPMFSQNFLDSENLSASEDYQEFENRCSGAGGGIVAKSRDGEAGGDCYKLSEDSTKSCSGDYECVYGCDFSKAVSSGVCVLFKTNKELASGIYTYEYNCNGEINGECSSLPLSSTWELQENKLIETGNREFPLEKEEFSPV